MTRKLAIATFAAALAVGANLRAETPTTKPAMPTPSAALDKLLEGNARFVAGTMTHPNLGQEARAELAKGQSPYAVIVGCADSRVPPELAFDAGPGDLFVIRVAGNVVDDYELGSVEYAVAKLGAPLVVVLGHEGCGAVGAAVASETQGAEFKGHIHDLVEAIRPAVEAAEKSTPPGGDLLEAAVAENARRVVEKLGRSKPYVGELAKEGKIEIVAARFDLDDGRVTLVGQPGEERAEKAAAKPAAAAPTGAATLEPASTRRNEK